MDSQKVWNIDAAKCHYRVDRWGLQFFDINSQGNVVAKTPEGEVDLYELSKSLRAKGITLPVLVRFPQILQKSLKDLSVAFAKAIESSCYAGNYIAAYPIKVNQQATVIQHFQEQRQWPIAFEVGSKAELMACLGIPNKKQTIICNGYKDETYIRLALMGSLLGHDVVIVIENLAEFEYVLKQSSELNVQANLGMRVRLTSIAKGNWQNTGGEYSKFGLTSSEILNLVKKMQDHDVLAWMKMLHFHMGSQISCLQDIQSGLNEGMQYFTQLAQDGVQFKQLNIGGGLAVDYEGSQSSTYFSMDYSVNDYANMAVNIVHAHCEKYSLAAPSILSENGRAMTAHHAVLLTNVIDVEQQYENIETEYKNFKGPEFRNEKLNQLVEHVNIIENSLGVDEKAESIIEDLKIIVESIELDFSAGKLSLHEKAIAERFVSYAYRTLLSNHLIVLEQDLKNIEDKFITKYFCNFSIFQSTPDIWGLNQIFPIMPLHRHKEYPSIKSRIYDLTCDSDGRIDNYVEADSVQSRLSLHEFNQAQDYILGVFLVGAYQEILGDMHNLFGDTYTANIILNPDGSYQICDEEPGDSISEILSYLHLDTGKMRHNWLERLSSNKVSGKYKELIINELEVSLSKNSYLS